MCWYTGGLARGCVGERTRGHIGRVGVWEGAWRVDALTRQHAGGLARVNVGEGVCTWVRGQVGV